MPVYEYQGAHYELADGLSNEQAIQKIKGHLGQGKLESQNNKVLDVIGGVAETMTTGVAGAFGGLGAQVAGSVKGMLDPTSTASQGRDEMSEAYSNSAIGKVLAPQTDTGKWIEEKIGHAIEGIKEDAALYANSPNSGRPGAEQMKRALGAGFSTLPEAAMVAPFVPGGKKMRPMRTTPMKEKAAAKKTGMDNSALAARMEQQAAEKTSSSSADRPQQLPETLQVTPEGQGILSPQDALFKQIAEQRAESVKAARPVEGRSLSDPFGQMKQQLDVPQSIPNESSVMAALVKSLQEQPMSAAEIQKAGGADKAIAIRQAALEQEVKQRAGLDFNAAERARQEQAPTGFQEHTAGLTGDRAIGATAEGLMDPATAAQRGIRAEEPMARQGAETLYTDPAGQTFRGNPADPMAILGLERQKEAARNALQHNIATKKGQPLDLLTREQLRAANEGPQVGMQELMQNQLKQELQSRAVAEHPFLRKAMEKVTKQEELITKLSEQVQKGKATAAKLAREVKNLENFEAALERTKLNVEKGIGEGQKPVPFGFKQRGAINPEVFKEGFEKIVPGIGKIEYHIKSRPDERGILPMVVVEAKMGKEKVGEFSFYSKENDLVAAGAETVKEFRNMGVARGAYEAVASLGNDIVPSGLQTKYGKAMWEGFKRGGLAEPHGRGYIPKKQKGAVLIDPGQAPQGKFLSENPALKLPTIVPSKLTAERTIELARNAPDVDQNFLQKSANLLTKGGLYQALKTNNPVVKFTYEKLSEADRLARGDIQALVHDQLGPATRALNKREKAQIWEAIDRADRMEMPLTSEMLREVGASEKQIAFVEAHRAVMDQSFEAINRARRAAGREPISKRTAYAAMKATGDYRKLVYKLDEQGQKVVVGLVGSDFRPTLNKRAKALEEQGYVIGEEQYFGGVPRELGNAQQALAHTLEILAEHDPRIKQFLDTLDDINKNEAYSFLNMKKHTMQKKGVFGMEGRKTWETAERNAHEGMQAQLQYAESALKWARLSEGIEAVRPVLADEGIKMPQAKKWADDYIKNALGYNPSKMGHNLEVALAHGIGETGIGYSNIRSGLAVARKSVNTLLLALDPGFWAANVIQPFRATPGMKQFLETKGLETNFDMGTGWSYLGKAAITDWKARTGRPLGAIEQGAFDYAKTHHVYGSDLVEHSNRASKDAGYAVDKVGNFVASNIESGTRQLMFFTFVDMLKQNGLSVKNGLYEAAHNLTDMSMNNYSPVERPPVYNSLGPVGDVSVNLSSFKHNEFSRLALFARQIAEEKSAKPLLVEMAASVAFAGITGTIAFAEADWLYRQVTKALGKPDSLTMRVIEMSEGAGKMMGGAKHALSHGAFSLLGVDMSKRLGLSNAVGDSAMDIAFPGGSKLVDVAEAGYNAAKSPTEMNAKRLAHEVVPRPAATNMDLEWFSKETPKGSLGLNRRTMEAQVMRTPGDKMAKRFGFTGINESVEKEKLYQTKAIKDAYADMRKKPLATAKDELFSKGRISDATIQKYLAAEGDSKTLMADISRMNKDQNIPAKDREMLHASMSKSITSLRHAQRLQKVYEK